MTEVVTRSCSPALCAVVAGCLLASAACSSEPADLGTLPAAATSATVGSDGPSAPLDRIDHWLYLIDVDLDDASVDDIAASAHDLVVLDFIPSEANNRDYPMATVVERLHEAPHPKLVLAYLDIGEAEDYRTYWDDAWSVGDPAWIVGEDPDGWEGNYPVAYWWDEWRDIWLGDGGLIAAVVDAGFDGIYLDWVEAYDDDNVRAAADRDGVDAAAEMVWWVEDLAADARARSPGFIVVGQNAAELAVASAAYRDVIDAIAQEQVWFDGGADNDPPGDCPLPRTEADVDGPGYAGALSDPCRRLWDEFPDSTLHVSSESYLADLVRLRDGGLAVFTVDYAEDAANVAWVLDESRRHGFVPFVGSRALDRFVPAR